MLRFIETANFYLFFLKFQAVVMILFMSISAVNFAPSHSSSPSSFFSLLPVIIRFITHTKTHLSTLISNYPQFYSLQNVVCSI